MQRSKTTRTPKRNPNKLPKKNPNKSPRTVARNKHHSPAKLLAEWKSHHCNQCSDHEDMHGYMCFKCAFLRSMAQSFLEEKVGMPVSESRRFLYAQAIKAGDNLHHEDDDITDTGSSRSSTSTSGKKAGSKGSTGKGQKISDDPQAYPIDSCPICLRKLFPERHGDAAEKRVARKNPKAWEVFEGSNCVHMFHRGCFSELLQHTDQKSETSKSNIAACPVCRETVEESKMVRVWFKGMEGGDVLLVSEEFPTSSTAALSRF